ncbi:MAG TPA: hypothetical protein VM580_00665 [Labilithrix sp.]|jgi:hypothetical protein|nr:hypothetical protein [Labilithrix sp.]
MPRVSLLASAYVIFLAITAAVFVRISRRHPAGSWPHDEITNLYAGFARTLLILAGVVLVVVAARHGSERHAPAYLGSAAVALAAVTAAAARRARRRPPRRRPPPER